MSAKLSRKISTLSEVLDEFLRLPISGTNRRLFEFNAQTILELHSVANSFDAIGVKFYGRHISKPTAPISDASVAAADNTAEVIPESLQGMVRQIVEAVEGYPYYGKVIELGDHECKFQYCNSRNTHGLLNTTHHISAHEHHLIDTRIRKLGDDDVILPAIQAQMVEMLPECLLPYVRIITGTLILQKENEAGTESHEHVVGRTIRRTFETIDRGACRAAEMADQAARKASDVAGSAASAAGHAVKEYGPTVAKGAAAVTGLAFLGGLLATAANFVVVAMTDPALVIGDVVISAVPPPRETAIQQATVQAKMDFDFEREIIETADLDDDEKDAAITEARQKYLQRLRSALHRPSRALAGMERFRAVGRSWARPTRPI
jgi:hypothetical protein